MSNLLKDPRSTRATAAFLLTVGVLAAPAAHAAPVPLFFSEYLEGSSNNKALEVFNNTGQTLDLSQITIRIFVNGASSASRTFNLPSGTLEHHHTYVIAHSSAVTELKDRAQMTTGNLIFNGNDAIELLYGNLRVDSIGQLGMDPGTAWGSGGITTADQTLRRMARVQTGDPVFDDAFEPGLEWLGLPLDTFDGLGRHDIADAPAPVPLPAAMPLLGSALLGIAAVARRRA